MSIENGAEKIQAKQLKDALDKDEDLCLIDVRSEDEFKSGTLCDACCIPHHEISDRISEIPKDKTLVLFCKSGFRSSKAKEALNGAGLKVIELEGGFDAWKKSKLPIVKQRSAIPLQRQVMIGAGSLVLTGSLLGLFFNSMFHALAVFVGAGLLFAGLTGFCGMAIVLEKMPWNR